MLGARLTCSTDFGRRWVCNLLGRGAGGGCVTYWEGGIKTKWVEKGYVVNELFLALTTALFLTLVVDG